MILLHMKVWHFWTSEPHISLRKLSTLFQRAHRLNTIVNWGHSLISAHAWISPSNIAHSHLTNKKAIYALPSNVLVCSRNVWRKKEENVKVYRETFWAALSCSQQLLILWQFFVPLILPTFSSVGIQFHCVFSTAAIELLFWVMNLTLLLGEGWPCC